MSLDLILAYVDTLRWPVFCGVVIYSFRKSIKGLLGRLVRAEGAGFAAEFSEVEKRARQKSESAKLPDSSEEPQQPGQTATATPGSTGRRPYQRVRIAELSDVVTVPSIVDAFDMVDLRVGTMSMNERLAVGVWALGYTEGSSSLNVKNYLKEDEDEDDLRIEITHKP